MDKEKYNKSAGKGDIYRKVNKKVYDSNFDEIDWKRDNDKTVKK